MIFRLNYFADIYRIGKKTRSIIHVTTVWQVIHIVLNNVSQYNVDLTRPSEGGTVADLQLPSAGIIYGCIMSDKYINDSETRISSSLGRIFYMLT